jgi:hypothetical protein
MVSEAARLALGFDRCRWLDGWLLPACEGGIGERKLAGDLGIFAFVPAEGGGARLGFTPAEIIAVVSHALPPVFRESKAF